MRRLATAAMVLALVAAGAAASADVRTKVVDYTVGGVPLQGLIAWDDAVEAFRKDMADAGASVEIVTYPGARHGFTNPDAGTFGMDALAYDAAADRESWAAMIKAFRGAF